MKEFLQGSVAVARAVKVCRPGVISAYPITPQTIIVESLARMVAEGELEAEFINVESEHSAASVILGASATGVRAYSATTSQGLLLMGEVLFNLAGLRLPVVITCVNRAVSAPINIWNDHQDSVTFRDAGLIQFYAETIQEACDLHLQAFRIGENPEIMLPVLVCMDGYILTHGFELVEVPEEREVERFLPPYIPPYRLNPENPLTMGPLAGPEYYMETRYSIQRTMEEVLELIPRIKEEFRKIFGRDSGGLLEPYRLEGAEKVLVGKGSMMGTVKEVVDELRAKGEKVGALKVITYRPFPEREMYEFLREIPRIGVLEKALSLGAYGPLHTDLKAVFQGKREKPQISGFVVGLGGRDVTKKSIQEAFDLLSGEEVHSHFIDLKL